MPAYVITPSGDVHVYHSANYAVRAERVTELYESIKKDRWIADIPKGWAVGWSQPRKVGTDTAAEELLRDIRNAPSQTLREIKKELQRFDSRTWAWKGPR